MAGKTSLLGNLWKFTKSSIAEILTLGGNSLGDWIASSNNPKRWTAAATLAAPIAFVAFPPLALTFASAAGKSAYVQYKEGKENQTQQTQNAAANKPNAAPEKLDVKEPQQEQNISRSKTQETQQIHPKSEQGMSKTKKLGIAVGLLSLTVISPPLGIMATVGLGASYGYNKIQAANQNQEREWAKKQL